MRLAPLPTSIQGEYTPVWMFGLQSLDLLQLPPYQSYPLSILASVRSWVVAPSFGESCRWESHFLSPISGVVGG